MMTYGNAEVARCTRFRAGDVIAWLKSQAEPHAVAPRAARTVARATAGVAR